MLDSQTFSCQKIAVVFLQPGDKAGISNENVVVSSLSGKVKCRIPFQQIFTLILVGNVSISSALMHQARKKRFCVILMDASFRVQERIGALHEGNTKVRRLQYTCPKLEIVQHIIANKIANQKALLKRQRHKQQGVLNAILSLEECQFRLTQCRSLNEIRACEGTASQVYFKNHFNNLKWKARKPREKHDPINAMLDLGYSILFVFIESLLSIYDYDLYCGFLHADAPKRKSLVCDMMEPFRPLIDQTIKEALNLKEFSPDDFSLYNNQYRLKSGKKARYVEIIFKALIDNKMRLFQYMLYFYRAFIGQKDAELYPVFSLEEKEM